MGHPPPHRTDTYWEMGGVKETQEGLSRIALQMGGGELHRAWALGLELRCRILQWCVAQGPWMQETDQAEAIRGKCLHHLDNEMKS